MFRVTQNLKLLSFILCCLFIINLGCANELDYVSMYIGTGYVDSYENSGNTFPGVGIPHGNTQYSPQTKNTFEKCIAPYYYQDTGFQGIRASHWLSGSCTQDYGSVTITGTSNTLLTNLTKAGCTFQHSQETMTPSYYSIDLSETSQNHCYVNTEVSALSYSGLVSFTWTSNTPGSMYITISTNSGVGIVNIDSNSMNSILAMNPAFRLYQGTGLSAGFSGNYIISFSKSFDEFGTFQGEDSTFNSSSLKGTKRDSNEYVGAYVVYNNMNYGDSVTVKLANSFSSTSQAQLNLNTEIESSDFSLSSVKSHSEEKWNQYLQSIQVTPGNGYSSTESNALLKKFYSAMYHAALLPRVFSDIDNTRVKFGSDEFDTTLYQSDFVYYDDYSMWDTFRAVHPLFTLIDHNRTKDMWHSIVAKSQDGMWMPIFPCWNSYTDEMIGDHCASLLTDAVVKGIVTNITDINDAYQFVKQNALDSPDIIEYLNGKGRRALKVYMKNDFVPLNDPIRFSYHDGEQVSRTLEYAYDDWLVSVMAKKVGDLSNILPFEQRGLNYKNVFNPNEGFVQGRYSNLSWEYPFDPTVEYSYLTEGTSWQWSFFVLHDVMGLIDEMGGNENFVSKLDTLFSQGYYNQGNEPSHHIPYLYNYAGYSYKAQEQISTIKTTNYTLGPFGLPGNDDAGQMSAWYVLSSIGFYQVCPGDTKFIIGTPTFEKTVISLPNGNQFTIQANNVSSTNIYIQSATLNGEVFSDWSIDYFQIQDGGTLIFEMGSNPNTLWP